MAVKVMCESDKGGAVQLGSEQVWASFAVATVGDHPAPPLFYAGVKLPNGKNLQLFVNQETGLVVVDVVNCNGRSGCEILRREVL